MTQTIVIEPGRIQRQYWRDLWRYRELLYFLAWRDVSVHYKQTAIGIAWAVIRPLATMAIFVIVFGRVAKLSPGAGVRSYALLVLAGMLPWQLFASTLAESSNSLVNNSNLISKVYFPRLVVPISSLAVGFVDLLVTCPILIGMMLYHDYTLSWRMLVLPLLLLMAACAALGAGFWLSALNVRYRDVRYAVPFILQFGLYLSPVGFSSYVIPKEYHWLYSLNPMVGIIDGFRWALFGTRPLVWYWYDPAVSVLVIVVLMVSGLWYFRRTERTFADVI